MSESGGERDSKQQNWAKNEVEAEWQCRSCGAVNSAICEICGCCEATRASSNTEIAVPSKKCPICGTVFVCGGGGEHPKYFDHLRECYIERHWQNGFVKTVVDDSTKQKIELTGYKPGGVFLAVISGKPVSVGANEISPTITSPYKRLIGSRLTTTDTEYAIIVAGVAANSQLYVCFESKTGARSYDTRSASAVFAMCDRSRYGQFDPYWLSFIIGTKILDSRTKQWCTIIDYTIFGHFILQPTAANSTFFVRDSIDASKLVSGSAESSFVDSKSSTHSGSGSSGSGGRSDGYLQKFDTELCDLIAPPPIIVPVPVSSPIDTRVSCCAGSGDAKDSKSHSAGGLLDSKVNVKLPPSSITCGANEHDDCDSDSPISIPSIRVHSTRVKCKSGTVLNGVQAMTFTAASNLVVVHSVTNQLFQLNPNTGETQPVPWSLNDGGPLSGACDIVWIEKRNALCISNRRSHHIQLLHMPSKHDMKVNPFIGERYGEMGVAGSADGSRSIARFNSPAGLLYDPRNEQLFVADRGNNSLRRFSFSNSKVSTLNTRLRDPRFMCWFEPGGDRRQLLITCRDTIQLVDLKYPDKETEFLRIYNPTRIVQLPPSVSRAMGGDFCVVAMNSLVVLKRDGSIAGQFYPPGVNNINPMPVVSNCAVVLDSNANLLVCSTDGMHCLRLLPADSDSPKISPAAAAVALDWQIVDSPNIGSTDRKSEPKLNRQSVGSGGASGGATPRKSIVESLIDRFQSFGLRTATSADKLSVGGSIGSGGVDMSKSISVQTEEPIKTMKPAPFKWESLPKVRYNHSATSSTSAVVEQRARDKDRVSSGVFIQYKSEAIARFYAQNFREQRVGPTLNFCTAAVLGGRPNDICTVTDTCSGTELEELKERFVRGLKSIACRSDVSEICHDPLVESMGSLGHRLNKPDPKQLSELLGLAESCTTRGGEGVRIAVIDSGVEDDAFDAKQIEARATFLNGSRFDHIAVDETGHGTDMAMNIAALVPASKLLIAKVLDSTGRGKLSDVMKAIEWARMRGAHIVNCSVAVIVPERDEIVLASGPGVRPKWSPVVDVFSQLSRAGVTVIAAMGNTNNPRFRAQYFPSCLDSVIAVGSCTVDGKAAHTSSARGHPSHYTLKPDVVVAQPGAGLDGTSSSASLVSALCAKLISCYKILRTKPDSLTPPLLRRILCASSTLPLPHGTPSGSPYFNFSMGYGRVNGTRTFQLLESKQPPSTEFYPVLNSKPIRRPVSTEVCRNGMWYRVIDGDGYVPITTQSARGFSDWADAESIAVEQQNVRCDLNALWPARKGKVEIPYAIDEGFSPAGQNAIQRAAAEWTRHAAVTTVSFQKHTMQEISSKGITHYVRISPLVGDSDIYNLGHSSIGCNKDGFIQLRETDVPHRRFLRTVLHELGHSIGLLHAHCHAMRDMWIRCNGSGPDYYIQQPDMSIGLYDPFSIMHYEFTASTEMEHKSNTQLPGNANPEQVGADPTLSESDIQSLADLYAMNSPTAVADCTRQKHGTTMIEGKYYRCITCFGGTDTSETDNQMVVCAECARVCHAGHTLKERFCLAFCDCGTRHKHSCSRNTAPNESFLQPLFACSRCKLDDICYACAVACHASCTMRELKLSTNQYGQCKCYGRVSCVRRAPTRSYTSGHFNKDRAEALSALIT